MTVAVATGGGVAVLLQFKPELHSIARKLGDEDLRAIMQFVLITCIILPVLPNQNYSPLDLLPPYGATPSSPAGPLAVLNPFVTWLMVVLIVGLSLGGYIIYKFFGRAAGILLGGVLGGAISSTATTVSYARGARLDPAGAWAASIVIMIASTVMYLRVLLAVAVISSQDLAFLTTLLVPVAVLMLLTLLPAMALWFRVRRTSSANARAEEPDPTEIGRGVWAVVCRGAAGVGRGTTLLERPGTLRRGVLLRPDGNGRHYVVHYADVDERPAGGVRRLADDRYRGNGQLGIQSRHRRTPRRLAAADPHRVAVCHPHARRSGAAGVAVAWLVQ